VEILSNSLSKTQMEQAARQLILDEYTWERLAKQVESIILMKDVIQ
jgi:glycosyltransferase involved in cell wall biosynthesis